MKKTVTIFICLFISIVSIQKSFAKGNDKNAASDAKWFFSVAGGAQAYFGEGDSEIGFSDRVTPALDVAFGRWFNHIWGARVQYNGMQAKGATHICNSYADELVSGSTYKQSFDYMNIHVDVLFNLNSAICNYSRRFYEIIPYVGLGYANAYKSNSPSESSLSVNGGLLNRFRLSRSFDINVDLRAMLVKEAFDNETGGFPLEGIGSATLGLTYRF